MSDTPIIGYSNLLQGSNYTVITGTDEPSAPLSDAWTWDMSRPALPRADSSGVLSFSVPTPTGLGYGEDAAGNFSTYGGSLYYGGLEVATHMILGAARNNDGGTRFSGGTLVVLADSTEVFNQTIFAPQNASALYTLDAHSAATTYTITISGLTADATVRLPEIFIGPVIQLPQFEFGFDINGEHTVSTEFKSGTGRIIRSRRFVRIEQSMRWRNLNKSQQNAIDLFIEDALENLQPFWFSTFPESKPTDTYLGINNMPNTAIIPRPGGFAEFSMKFVEAL